MLLFRVCEYLASWVWKLSTFWRNNAVLPQCVKPKDGCRSKNRRPLCHMGQHVPCSLQERTWNALCSQRRLIKCVLLVSNVRPVRGAVTCCAERSFDALWSMRCHRVARCFLGNNMLEFVSARVLWWCSQAVEVSSLWLLRSTLVEHKLGGCDRAAPCSANVQWVQSGKSLCVVDVTTLWLGKAVANMGAGSCASSRDLCCQDCRDMVAWSAQFPWMVDVCCPIGCWMWGGRNMDRAVFATTCAHQVGQAVGARRERGVHPEGGCPRRCVAPGNLQPCWHAQENTGHVPSPSWSTAWQQV